MASKEINEYISKFNVSNIQRAESLKDVSFNVDQQSPLSFKQWLKEHTFIISGQEFSEYNNYLKQWYSNKEFEKQNQASLLKNDYINFINELSLIFKDDEDFKYISDIDFDDNVDIEYAIPFFTKKIKEICFYIIGKRESSKKAKIKYNMSGSNQALEKLFYQYILQAFTQKNTLIQVPEFSGVEFLPPLSSISNSFNISIEEINDGGNYFDRDPSVEYFSDSDTTEYFDRLNFPQEESKWIFESGYFPVCADNPLFYVLSSTLEFYGVNTTAELPFSAVDLTDQFNPNPNQVNEVTLSKKYLGTDFYLLTGGYYILKNQDFSFDFSNGNNWFYWPSGEAKFENDDASFDAIKINETSLLESGATSAFDYRNADKIFVEKNNGIFGAWLRAFKSTTQTLNMSCAVGADQSVEFKFPYPDYGIVGDGTSWSGKGTSNINSQYQILDDQTKKLVDDIYWEDTTQSEQVCAIDINASTLVKSGSLASIYYNGADKISKRLATDLNKVNDSQRDSVYKDGFEYAWLYKFLKTDLPVKTGRNEYQFPIERVEVEKEKYLTIDDEICNPVSLNSIDIDTFLGSRAGYFLGDSDIIYKLSGKGGYPVECAYLVGVPLSAALPTDVLVTGLEEPTYLSTATGNMQIGLTIKAKPDTPETFLWQDEDTPITDLDIKYHPHQDDCPFLLYSEHKSLFDQKSNNEFEFTYPWKDCECKSVLFSPIGHPGEKFSDYSGMSDIIVLDTQDPKPFSLKEWKDLSGRDYRTSPDFAWYKIEKTETNNQQGLDIDVGMGQGRWVTGSGDTFTFKKGRQYKYIRSGLLRPQSEINSDAIPPLVITYKYNHNFKPTWKKATLTNDGNWTESNLETDMILNPGDFILYDHFESNFYCLEYENTYKEFFTSSTVISGSNPNNNPWVNFTKATTGLNVIYKWIEKPYEGIPDEIKQTNVLASNLSSVNWYTEIVNVDGDLERYNTVLSPEVDFNVFAYTPQSIYVTAYGNVDGTLTEEFTQDFETTIIPLPKVEIIEPETIFTPTFSGEKLKQTIYADTLNFVLNVPLSGWNYATNSFDGVSLGAKPFWGEAIDDGSITTKFKGVREWGYGLRLADEYTFIHQPPPSFMTFSTNDTLKYTKKNTGFVWDQPVKFVRNDSTTQWCDLIVEQEKEHPLSYYLKNEDKELVVYPTSTISDLTLEVGDFVNYWSNASFVWTQNLSDSSAGIPPNGGTFVPYGSSLLIEADVPYANITNRHFPSVAVYPNPSNFYTDRDSGSYFNHKGLGILTYINKNFTNIVNPNLSANELSPEEMIFRDPNVFTSNDLGLTEKRKKGPIVNSENDSRWMKGNIVQGYKSGQIVVEDDYKEFVPYQVKEETTKRNSSGLLDISFDLDPWTDKFDNKWKDTINWPPNFRKQYPVKEWNFELDYFVKRQYFETYDRTIKLESPFICDPEPPCSEVVLSKEFDCTICLGPELREPISCLFSNEIYPTDSYSLTSDGGVILQVNNDYYKLNYLPLYKFDKNDFGNVIADPINVIYGEQRDDVKSVYFGMLALCFNNTEFYTPVYRSLRTNCEVTNLTGVYSFDDFTEFTQFGFFPISVNEVDTRFIELYTKDKIPTTTCSNCPEINFESFANCYSEDSFTFNPKPVSAYAVTPVRYSVREGESLDFIVETYNIPNGTTLYWNIKHETSSIEDFSPETSGQITIQNSKAFIQVNVKSDSLIEGEEEFRVQIREQSLLGDVKAFSDVVNIIDVIESYSIVADKTSVDEGGNVVFSIETENVDDGTIIYWTLQGDVDEFDFTPNGTSGNVTINNNEAEFTINISSNSDVIEGPEDFTASLRKNSISGSVVATSQTITINDTSKPQISAPDIEPNTGTYTSAVQVTISHPSGSSATIYYTTNGSQPTTSSSVYTAPFTLSDETAHVIKAIAYVDGYDPSDVTTETITIVGSGTLRLTKTTNLPAPAISFSMIVSSPTEEVAYVVDNDSTVNIPLTQGDYELTETLTPFVTGVTGLGPFTILGGQTTNITVVNGIIDLFGDLQQIKDIATLSANISLFEYGDIGSSNELITDIATLSANISLFEYYEIQITNETITDIATLSANITNLQYDDIENITIEI